MTAQSLIDNAREIVTKKYFCFEGRADLAEFWQFILVLFVASMILNFIGAFIGMSAVLGGLFSLATLAPALGCSVRRLHDIGKSGWTLLFGLIPLFGPIYLIILLAKRGEKTDCEKIDGEKTAE